MLSLCWLLQHLQAAAAHDLLENGTTVMLAWCSLLFGVSFVLSPALYIFLTLAPIFQRLNLP